MLHEKYGKDEELVAYEDFLSDPDNTIYELNCWAWWDMYEKKERNLTLTVPLGILYQNKFNNYNQIKEWFGEG